MLFIGARYRVAGRLVALATKKAVEEAATALAIALPDRPTVADLSAARPQLAVLRKALGEFRRQTAHPAYLPPETIDDLRLTLWALGLAHECSRSRTAGHAE